jgi:glycosyltransferase involved in cell wall biosynthesis
VGCPSSPPTLEGSHTWRPGQAAGVFVPQRSPNKLAAAMRLLMEDGRLYESRRRAAIGFAPSPDWDSVTERLDSVIFAMVEPAAPLSRAR